MKPPPPTTSADKTIQWTIKWNNKDIVYLKQILNGLYRKRQQTEN